MNTWIVITAGFQGGCVLKNEDIPFACVSVTATAGASVAGLGSSIALSRPPWHTTKRPNGQGYTNCGREYSDARQTSVPGFVTRFGVTYVCKLNDHNWYRIGRVRLWSRGHAKVCVCGAWCGGVRGRVTKACDQGGGVERRPDHACDQNASETVPRR